MIAGAAAQPKKPNKTPKKPCQARRIVNFATGLKLIVAT